MNSTPETPAVRAFETGATRSGDAGRYDPEGFLSPIVIERFAEYMQKHRVQPDGSIRASDNWQKGMPIDTYMKGMWRHFLHLWTRHRGFEVQDPGAAKDIEEDLCALLFNVQGMLFEVLKNKRKPAAGISMHLPPIDDSILGPLDPGKIWHDNRNERLRAAVDAMPLLDPRARIVPGREEEWRDAVECLVRDLPIDYPGPVSPFQIKAQLLDEQGE